MYAVIKTGGKQYKVCEGESLRVEKIAADAGTALTFAALMIGDEQSIKIGTPTVDGVTVNVTVESHGRGQKVKIIKFRRRKHSRKQMGHRQDYTQLKITAITA
jgi:large subunit ribosomal protein L21